MRAVLRYKPFFLLAIELDAQWSRKRTKRDSCSDSNDPIYDLKVKIESLCKQYKESIEATGRKYQQHIGSDRKLELAEFLFKPLFCFPTGHADGYCLVLVDDFDFVQHFSAHSRVIEDMSLAFCPEAESVDGKIPPSIVDVEDHFTGQSGPVVVLSKFKLDGLCNLEFGLLFKRAIFRAMIRRIEASAKAFERCDHVLVDPLPHDLKVSLLSLQGQEEIGVLVSTRNVTLAVAISSAIRTIDVREVFRDDDDNVRLLSYLVFESPEFQVGPNGYAPGNLHRSLFPRGRNGPLPTIPVFRWSKSHLAFRLNDNGSEVALASPVSGLAYVTLDFQVAPGVPLSRTEFKNPTTVVECIPPGWAFAEIGAFDFRVSTDRRRGLVEAREAVCCVLEYVRSIVRLNNSGKRSPIVGIKSTFSIPVPETFPFFLDFETEESPLDRTLYRVRTFLEEQNENGLLSMKQLLEFPRFYGVPRALRRSIEALYQQFLTTLVNPNLYDLVIDLLDAFCTMHSVLTKLLPTRLRTSKNSYESLAPQSLEAIAHFATTLRNALERRLGLAFPDSTVRNISLQFPGSLVQMLFSADAPLKAGIGVLKYYLPRERDSENDDKKSSASLLSTVGVLVDITLEPGIRIRNLSLPKDNNKKGGSTTQLSFLHLDVDHLFQVGSFFDYIHETFHLAFEELIVNGENRGAREIAKRLRVEEQLTARRIEELFVQLGCFVFCSPDRPMELVRYLVGKYTLDPRSGTDELIQTYKEFVERLCLLGIPCWLVESFLTQTGGLPPVKEWHGLVQQFLTPHLEVLFKLFPESANSSGEAREDIEMTFSAHLGRFWESAQMDYYLPKLWDLARGIYESMRSHHPGFELDKRFMHSDALNRVSDGWAVTRYEYSSCIDCVPATALLLQRYVTRADVMSQVDTDLRFQMDRDPGTREILFSYKRYANFLIERGSAQRYCFDPVSRSQRLRHQIGTLESFWDFSSHFRARRLKLLIDSTCGT